MSSLPGAPPLTDVARRLLCREDVEAYAVVGGEAVRVERMTRVDGAPVVTVAGWRWPSDEPDVVGELLLRERARLAQVRLLGWWEPIGRDSSGQRLRLDVATVAVRDEERLLEVDAADVELADLLR